MKIIGFKAAKSANEQDKHRSIERLADGYKFTMSKLFNEKLVDIYSCNITDEEIAQIANDKNSEYTLWACWNQGGIAQWVNVYQQTVATKIGRREFLRDVGAYPFAFLIIPPGTSEATLVLELFDGDTFPEGVVEREFAQDNFSAEIESVMPTITLSAENGANDYVTVTATSSQPLDGVELRWETTGGLLDMYRTIFNGENTSVIVKKPLSAAPFKVKCGFKYFSGVAEILV